MREVEQTSKSVLILPRAQLKPATFSTSRLLDFCSEKELTTATGHPPDEWPLVILKELVDNALDACEGADIAPVITMTVDTDGITVADNGPGVPAETVKGLLDYSVRVSSREAYVSLTRGAQGNALQTIFAMPYVLAGDHHGQVHIEASGVRHSIDFSADHIQQKPVIAYAASDSLVQNGTSVRVQWPLSSKVKLTRHGGPIPPVCTRLHLVEPPSAVGGGLVRHSHNRGAYQPVLVEVAPV